MKRINLVFAVISLGVISASPGGAQTLPPIRQIGPVTAVSKEPPGAVSTLRHLPGGRVFVDDILGRRVIMFDSSLLSVTVVAHPTRATPHAHGVRPGGLIA